MMSNACDLFETLDRGTLREHVSKCETCAQQFAAERSLEGLFASEPRPEFSETRLMLPTRRHVGIPPVTLWVAGALAGIIGIALASRVQWTPPAAVVCGACIALVLFCSEWIFPE
jgi:hypothetical protein